MDGKLESICRRGGKSYAKAGAIIYMLFQDTDRIIEGVRNAAPRLLVDHLERENQRLRNLLEMSDTNTNNRRRIEDMTLSEIKALKTRLEDRIGEAICVAIEDFQRAYDLGDVDLSVETDIRRFRDMSGVEVADPTIKYNVNVKFTDAEL